MRYSFASNLAAEPVRISARAGSCAVAVGDEVAVTFDGEGRLLTATIEDYVHKRGQNHRLVRKWHDGGRRNNVTLPPDERDALLWQVNRHLKAVIDELPADAPDAIRRRLMLGASWDQERYAADAERFNEAYKPIGILPPDQYMAVVVQASEGCHYNRCTFCQFYRGTPFRVKNPDEFQLHVDRVIAFIGRSAPLRRTVFLADANALVASQRRLIDLFSVLERSFAFAPESLTGRRLVAWQKANPFGKIGIYSFMDAFTADPKPAEEFAALRQCHLKRIYIGMESGHVPLLDFLRKPSKPEQVLETVQNAKAGGVNVGVIVMTGIGGRDYAHEHVRDSVKVLNGLPLGPGDLVYLSPFREDKDSEYARIAYETGLKPLSHAEGQQQAAAVRRGLDLAAGVKVAVYDVDEFVY